MNDSRTYYELGREALDAGDVERAIPLFEESLVQEYDHVTTHQLLGQCYFHVGQQRRALHHLAIVLKHQPENTGALISAVMALVKAGRAKSAAQLWQSRNGGPLPKRLRTYLLGEETARQAFGI